MDVVSEITAHGPIDSEYLNIPGSNYFQKNCHWLTGQDVLELLGRVGSSQIKSRGVQHCDIVGEVAQTLVSQKQTFESRFSDNKQ